MNTKTVSNNKVTITPRMAQNFLVTNTKNRPLSETHVIKLAKEMINGRWKFNGDSIRISDAGYLIDGQHRLHACIKSNTPFETYLIEGLDSDVFDTIDVNKVRSAANMLGQRGEVNTAKLSSTLMVVDRYFNNKLQVSGYQYTNTEIEQLLHKYPKVRESVKKTMDNKKLIQPSVLAACHYLFSLKDPDAADKFINDLITGKNLQEGDAVYYLRERLMLNAMSKAKLTRPYLMGLTIKAWNFRRRGQNIKLLRYKLEGGNSETFPIVE